MRSATRLLLLALSCLAQGGTASDVRSIPRPVDRRPELRLRGGVEPLSEAELNELVDRATRLSPGPCHRAPHDPRTVLPVWNGRSLWLWGQWRGTIFEATWTRIVAAMLASAGVIAWTWLTASEGMRWPIWSTPAEDHPIVKRLLLMHHLWSFLLTITTFVTTFMIGHAYTFWRNS